MTPHSFMFRPGTEDEANFRAVVTNNEYRLPDQLPANSIVLDVGAHCGSFMYKALQSGASLVLGYEVDHGNYEAALYNLRNYRLEGKAAIRRAAVWRSDGKGPKTLTFQPSEDLKCTGGGNVLWGPPQGQVVPTIPLDTILEEVTSYGLERVHMIKIDCEGSEWPILLTSNKLFWVDSIVGEYHEIGGPNMAKVLPEQAHKPFIPDCAKVDGHVAYTADTLKTLLLMNGFTKVEVIPGPAQKWLGWFFAYR
jgi:FkbM family methyltransferase